MANWKEYRLGELITLNYGKSLISEKRKLGKYPVFSSAGITGWHNEPLINSKAIIIGRKGTVGTVYYSDRPFYCIDTAYYILPNDEKYNFKFLYYLLKNLGLNKLNEDSAVPGLNRDTAYSQLISLPNLKTQNAIAEILTSLDGKIELNNQINQNLEALAQALFKQWFIDFDFPDENGLPYKSSGGQMVVSELGEIPKGWTIGILDDLVSIKGGTTPNTTDPTYWDGDFYWTSPKDLSNLKCPVLLTTEKRITKEGLKKIGSGLLPKGTLLLSSRAPIGYLAITEIETAINQGYIAINSKSGCSNQYMLYWLKQNMDVIISHANGSTFLEISKSKFRQIKVVIPPAEIHNSFYEQARVIFEQLIVNQRETQLLSQLRDYLLPKLISGELKVSEALALETV